MGCVASTAQAFVPVPHIKGSMNQSELRSILAKDCPQAHIINFDDQYDLFDAVDLSAFLKVNANPRYITERFDCDDFALVLVGRMRLWARTAKGGGGGICVGILTGDLKLTATSGFRGHAVGFFVDSNKQIKLIENDNSIVNLEPWHEVWTVIV